MQYSSIIDQANAAKFSPDSHFFVYTNSKLFYLKECSVFLENRLVLDPKFQEKIIDILISPNSHMVALQSKDRISLYDSKLGELVGKIEDPQGIVSAIWSPDSLALVVFSQLLYKCSIYCLKNKAVYHFREPKISSTKGCVFSSNGKLMALLQRHDCKDYIGIYTCQDWKMQNCIAVDTFDAVEIRWAPNDYYIIVCDSSLNYKFCVVCPFNGIVHRYEAYEYGLGIKSIDYSPNSSFLAVGSYDEKVRLFNTLSWKLIIEWQCSTSSIVQCQTRLYKQEEVARQTRIKLVDTSKYLVPTSKVVSDKGNPNQGVGLLIFSKDNEYLACRNDNMPLTIWVWKVDELLLSAVITLMTPIRGIEWRDKNNMLSIVCGTERVIFWSNDTISECSLANEQKGFNVNRIVWSGDYRKVLLLDKNSNLMYADMLDD